MICLLGPILTYFTLSLNHLKREENVISGVGVYHYCKKKRTIFTVMPKVVLQIVTELVIQETASRCQWRKYTNLTHIRPTSALHKTSGYVISQNKVLMVGNDIIDHMTNLRVCPVHSCSSGENNQTLTTQFESCQPSTSCCITFAVVFSFQTSCR